MSFIIGKVNKKNQGRCVKTISLFSTFVEFTRKKYFKIKKFNLLYSNNNNQPLLYKIMNKSIKGTKTEKNLLVSFAGESQARMRYTYFASTAKKEGFEQIAAIFTETADQEKEHAKRMFKYLEGGSVEITASYPAGVIASTLQNLQAAAAGEHEEWFTDYPHFADVAEEEGFFEIATMYRNISMAEKGHEERYRSFINNIENASVFVKEGEVVWQCRNCGYIYVGKAAPEECPACLHPKAYFEIKKNNF